MDGRPTSEHGPGDNPEQRSFPLAVIYARLWLPDPWLGSRRAGSLADRNPEKRRIHLRAAQHATVPGLPAAMGLSTKCPAATAKKVIGLPLLEGSAPTRPGWSRPQQARFLLTWRKEPRPTPGSPGTGQGRRTPGSSTMLHAAAGAARRPADMAWTPLLRHGLAPRRPGRRPGRPGLVAKRAWPRREWPWSFSRAMRAT